MTTARIVTTVNANIAATLITHQERTFSAQHNLRHHSAVRTAEAGKSTRRHAHMHTREEIGIAVETAQDLEASFAWASALE